MNKLLLHLPIRNFERDHENQSQSSQQLMSLTSAYGLGTLVLQLQAECVPDAEVKAELDKAKDLQDSLTSWQGIRDELSQMVKDELGQTQGWATSTVNSALGSKPHPTPQQLGTSSSTGPNTRPASTTAPVPRAKLSRKARQPAEEASQQAAEAAEKKKIAAWSYAAFNLQYVGGAAGQKPGRWWHVYAAMMRNAAKRAAAKDDRPHVQVRDCCLNS